MDELHAAIAAHLRAQRRPLTPEEFDATPPVGPLVCPPANTIPRIWRDRRAVPQCRYCGAPIDGRDGFFLVEELLLARACAAHHNRGRGVA